MTKPKTPLGLCYSHPTKWVRYDAHIVAPWLRPSSEHPDRVLKSITRKAKGWQLDDLGRMMPVYD